MENKKYVSAVDVADKFHDMLGIPYSEMVDVLACVNAADVVKVVRCGECIYSELSKTVNCAYVCKGNNLSPCKNRITYSNFGCLYGERKAVRE